MRRGTTKAADYWALGVLIFEMLVGDPPFKSLSGDPWDTFRRTLSGRFYVPNFISESASSLICQLLQVGHKLKSHSPELQYNKPTLTHSHSCMIQCLSALVLGPVDQRGLTADQRLPSHSGPLTHPFIGSRLSNATTHLPARDPACPSCCVSASSLRCPCQQLWGLCTVSKGSLAMAGLSGYPPPGLHFRYRSLDSSPETLIGQHRSKPARLQQPCISPRNTIRQSGDSEASPNPHNSCLAPLWVSSP